jgi:SSS family solute:Na+ symporter
VAYVRSTAYSAQESKTANNGVTVGRGIIPPKINRATRKPLRDKDGRIMLDYDLATPMMLIHYFSAGMLGLGFTALLALFMSGMAGNVTAFNTV